MQTSSENNRPAKVRLCGLWKDSIKNKKILTGGLCGGIKLVLIPDNHNPESRKPNAFLYSVTKDMLRTARDNGVDEESFKGYRVTGLWLKESRNGKYYAGDWEPDTSLFVFRNNNQQPGKNQPDYEVFLVPNVRKSMEAEQSVEQDIFGESTEEELQDDWMDFDSSRAEHPVDDEYAGMSFD
jgi:hypothetical protein